MFAEAEVLMIWSRQIFETTWQRRRGKLRQPPGTAASSAALYQLYVLKGQAAHRLSSCRKNGVEYRRRHDADGWLPDAAPEVVGRNNHCFDLGHLRKAHDLVSVEVEIRHPTVLDRHFAVERGGETEGDRSLHLGRDLAGIYRMAAIERQHHAMNLQLALRADRDLSGGSRVAAVAHELRNTAMHARR